MPRVQLNNSHDERLKQPFASGTGTAGIARTSQARTRAAFQERCSYSHCIFLSFPCRRATEDHVASWMRVIKELFPDGRGSGGASAWLGDFRSPDLPK